MYLNHCYFLFIINEEIACEGDKLAIRCPKGMKIDIRDVVYGRSNGDTCKGGNIGTTDCASTTSIDKVKKKCNGHRKCKVNVSNKRLGGDPCPGTSKYLSVKYVCEGKFHGLILT